MTINLDDEELGALDYATLTAMLEASLSTPEKSSSSSEERQRIERERKIAATSLYYPQTNPLPNPFGMQANPQISSLGQKISNLSGIEGIDRVSQASSQAFPSSDFAESIYDIVASQPAQPVPASSIIEQAQANLENMRDRGLANALLASTPEEILESAEEMGFVADLSDEELIEEAIAAVPAASSFPFLALEIMQLGMAMEGFQTQKLAGYKKEADVHKKKIDLLIKLSTHLPRLSSEDGPQELKEEAKVEIHKLHEELKALDIDVFPGMVIGNEFTKEQLASANSSINHYIETNRTAIQDLFTTKIGVAIQFLSMIGEVMKKVSEKDDQIKRKALTLPH